MCVPMMYSSAPLGAVSTSVGASTPKVSAEGDSGVGSVYEPAYMSSAAGSGSCDAQADARTKAREHGAGATTPSALAI